MTSSVTKTDTTVALFQASVNTRTSKHYNNLHAYPLLLSQIFRAERLAGRRRIASVRFASYPSRVSLHRLDHGVYRAPQFAGVVLRGAKLRGWNHLKVAPGDIDGICLEHFQPEWGEPSVCWCIMSDALNRSHKHVRRELNLLLMSWCPP